MSVAGTSDLQSASDDLDVAAANGAVVEAANVQSVRRAEVSGRPLRVYEALLVDFLGVAFDHRLHGGATAAEAVLPAQRGRLDRDRDPRRRRRALVRRLWRLYEVRVNDAAVVIGGAEVVDREPIGNARGGAPAPEDRRYRPTPVGVQPLRC